MIGDSIVLYAFLHIILHWTPVTIVSEDMMYSTTPGNISNVVNDIPTAVDDVYTLLIGSDSHILSANLLDNDIFTTDKEARIAFITAPETGLLSCGSKGNFLYITDINYTNQITFSYRLCYTDEPENYSDAKVTIYIDKDSDNDEIIDALDIDDDNDGILDIHEGEGLTDFDGDGFPDSQDIDSDNDGITDFIEWQSENSTILLSHIDCNKDGWDDAFDSEFGGNYYEAVDTDLDGSPDFIDTDSDADEIEDYIEAIDDDNDGIINMIRYFMDSDMDGLIDCYDTVSGCGSINNSISSNCPLPDFNKNGIRDWRDEINHKLEGNENLARAANELLIYPNPVQDICTVEIPVETNEIREYMVSLFDTNGKLLLRRIVNKNPFQLNVNNYHQSSFIIHAKANQNYFFGKIIKQP